MVKIEEKEAGSEFENLDNLLSEILEWEQKYPNEISSKKSEQAKERAESVDLVFKEDGELDLEYLENKIKNCKDEYIKGRIPSDVDLYLCTLANDTSECRRREKAKKIAEYFV